MTQPQGESHSGYANSILLVAGSRTLRDYWMLEQVLLSFILDNGIERGSMSLLSGGAKGADFLAEVFAARHNIPMLVIEPDWKVYGKRAGMLRNSTMVTRCTHACVFWDNKSRGTAHTVELLGKSGKSYRVHLFKPAYPLIERRTHHA